MLGNKPAFMLEGALMFMLEEALTFMSGWGEGSPAVARLAGSPSPPPVETLEKEEEAEAREAAIAASSLLSAEACCCRCGCCCSCLLPFDSLFRDPSPGPAAARLAGPEALVAALPDAGLSPASLALGPAEEAGVGDLAALDVLEVPRPRWLPRFRIVRSSGTTVLLRSTVVISSEVAGALRVLSRALVAFTTRSRWTPDCPLPCWACGSSALEGPPEPPKVNPESSEGQESPEAIPWESMRIELRQITADNLSKGWYPL